MPTLTYKIEVRCLNCDKPQVTTVRRGRRWVNAGKSGIGSGYYRQNDPEQIVKKICEYCGCDALIMEDRHEEA